MSYYLMEDIRLNPTDKSEIRNGQKCYVSAVTLTFKDFTSVYLGTLSLCAWIRRCQSGLIDWVFYPEYTQKGNIHFHGTVYYKNKSAFLSWMYVWSYHYGFHLYKPIDKLITWHIYCIKDQSELKEDLSEELKGTPNRPIRINRFNRKQMAKWAGIKHLDEKERHIMLISA